MTEFDKKFIDLCKTILTNGVESECRAKWPDNAPARTLHIANVCTEYDIEKEFPIMTLRKQSIAGPIKEILWIFQKKSNNVNDLGLHIWNAWADEDGSIGKAYGYQISKKYCHHRELNFTPAEFVMKAKEVYPSYEIKGPDDDNEMYRRDIFKHCFDQMDAVLYDLRNNPTSRRILTNTYCLEDLNQMNLYPCAYGTTWTVIGDTLNLLLNQRSQDVLAANYWNVCQYAALLVMVATATGLRVGKLTHVIADCHIYDRHIPIIEELINRDTYDYPLVSFDYSEIANIIDPFNSKEYPDFYKFSTDCWKLTNYKSGEVIKNIPVAE